MIFQQFLNLFRIRIPVSFLLNRKCGVIPEIIYYFYKCCYNYVQICTNNKIFELKYIILLFYLIKLSFACVTVLTFFSPLADNSYNFENSNPVLLIFPILMRKLYLQLAFRKLGMIHQIVYYKRSTRF